MTRLLSIDPSLLIMSALIPLIISAVFAATNHIRIAVTMGVISLWIAFIAGISLTLLITGATQ